MWSDTYFDSSLYVSDGTFMPGCREDYPGLVEVEFTVVVTGSGDGDFTFSVALNQAIYSKRTNVVRLPWATPCGAWGYPLDALLMLEYQHFTDIPAMCVVADDPDDAGPPTLYQPAGQIEPRLLSSNGRRGGLDRVRRWLAYYACYPIRPMVPRSPRVLSGDH